MSITKHNWRHNNNLQYNNYINEPWTFDIHLTCYHFIDDTHKITFIASSIERFNAVISTDGAL